MNPSGMGQEGEQKRTTVDASKALSDVKTGLVALVRDKPGGSLSIG
jgi:hypothetical protein